MATKRLNSFEIIGANELNKQLYQLTPKQQNRAFTNAMKASGKILEKEISREVTSELPNIPKKPIISPNTHKQTPSHKEIITYAGYSDYQNDFYFKTTVKPHGMLKWFITGTKERPLTKSGQSDKRLTFIKSANVYRYVKNTGKIEGKFLVEKAKANKGDEAIKEVDNLINKAIQAQWNKHNNGQYR